MRMENMRSKDNNRAQSTTSRVSDRRVILRILPYLKRHYGLLFIAAVVIAAIACVQVWEAILTSVVIDSVKKQGLVDEWSQPTLLMLCALLSAIFVYVQIYLLGQLGQLLAADLRADLFGHIQRLPVRYFDRTPAGKILVQLTSDVDTVKDLFGSAVVAVTDFLSFLFILIALFWLDPTSTGLLFGSSLTIPLIVIASGRFMRREAKLIRDRLDEVAIFMHDRLDGAVSVRALGVEKPVIKRFHALNEVHKEADLKLVKTQSLIQAGVRWLGRVSTALVVWYCASRVLSNEASLGAVVAFIRSTDRYLQPLFNISDKASLFQSSLVRLERIFLILDLPIESSGKITHATSSTTAGQISIAPTVEFRDVWFAHRQMGATGDWDWILRGVSLQVASGEKVAIMGRTGVGKSTLLHLLMGFYLPQRGKILINGRDISELPVDQLRASFKVVLQESASYSIYGRGHSVGQRQAEALDEAFLHGPSIFLLDEPTSQLDSAAEQHFVTALKRQRGATMILVTHRTALAQTADRLFTLESGQIRESAPRDIGCD
jgi:ATP-binding cassette, subfamily B, multidrug efflux pump